MYEQIQQQLKLNAVLKVFIGEGLSPQDFERVMDFILNHPIQFAEVSQEQQEAMKAQLINGIQQRFLQPPPQQ